MSRGPVGENLDLAPADILLSTTPETLAGVPGRENVLTWAFAHLDDRYDYVIVDCPPSVGLLTFNALKACTEAVIPMDPSFFSLQGIGKLFETFEMLERATGHRISARVLVTLYSGRSPFVKAVVEEVHRHLPGRYFETVVRYSVKLAEAASHGLPITRYAKESAGFADYRALANEILRQEAAIEPVEEAADRGGARGDTRRRRVHRRGARCTAGSDRGRLQRLEAGAHLHGAGGSHLAKGADARAGSVPVPLRDRRRVAHRSDESGGRAEPVQRERLSAGAGGAGARRTLLRASLLAEGDDHGAA